MLKLLKRIIYLGFFCVTMSAVAEEKALSATELAARLGEVVEDGDSATRLRLTIAPAGGGEKIIFQVQVKARRTSDKTDVLYQVLWPKVSKGQAFLIQQDRGGTPKGVAYDSATKKVTTLSESKMKDSLPNSDLAYQDVVENFFRWEEQKITGTEEVDRVECVILESKPGSKDLTPYSKVRTWIDPRRLVALRVEKYDASGKLARKIDTTRVTKDSGNYIPASLVVRRADGSTVTEIEGSNIRHDVKYEDKDFTTAALNDFRLPR